MATRHYTPAEVDAMRSVVSRLARLVEGALPARTQVGFAMRQATYTHADEFNALDAATQTRVCNGWNPAGVTEQPASDSLAQSYAECCEVACAMTIEGSSKGVDSCLDWTLVTGIAPVSVSILFGTTKADALMMLDGIRDAIAQHWDAMIQNPTLDVSEHDRKHLREATMALLKTA
jgi:hypothetical protein